jgi:hypothetical protein
MQVNPFDGKISPKKTGEGRDGAGVGTGGPGTWGLPASQRAHGAWPTAGRARAPGAWGRRKRPPRPTRHRGQRRRLPPGQTGATRTHDRHLHIPIDLPRPPLGSLTDSSRSRAQDLRTRRVDEDRSGRLGRRGGGGRPCGANRRRRGGDGRKEPARGVTGWRRGRVNARRRGVKGEPMRLS